MITNAAYMHKNYSYLRFNNGNTFQHGHQQKEVSFDSITVNFLWRGGFMDINGLNCPTNRKRAELARAQPEGALNLKRAKV